MKNFIILLIFLGFVPSTYALTLKRYIFEKTDLGQKFMVKDHELSVIYEENIIKRYAIEIGIMPHSSK